MTLHSIAGTSSGDWVFFVVEKLDVNLSKTTIFIFKRSVIRCLVFDLHYTCHYINTQIKIV